MSAQSLCPSPAAPPFSLKPTHKAVRGYYLALAQLSNVGAAHESAVRAAFDTLIESAASPLGWTLVREYAVSRKGIAPLKLDGVLLDSYRIPHGVLEAKDDADDLAVEMRAKLKLGYPSKNTLFWQPRRALLVQDGKVTLDYQLDLLTWQLIAIVESFFSYRGDAMPTDGFRCSPPPAAFFPLTSDYNRALSLMAKRLIGKTYAGKMVDPEAMPAKACAS